MTPRILEFLPIRSGRILGLIAKKVFSYEDEALLIKVNINILKEL
tara:strand:+ start:1167 stop:1301 length:135 start_codon:yes stop_codon:yes gene_type:complete